MLELLKKYLDLKGWHYSKMKGKTVFLFGISGENGRFDCIIDLDEEQERMVFFSIFGVNTPEPKRQNMSELITRLNFLFIAGNLEMDYNDGEVRFKTSFFYETLKPTFESLDNIILRNIMTMDISLPSITSAMFEEKTPIEILQSNKDLAINFTEK